MKLSDHVMDFLARQGVKYVFFVAGGGSMHLNDSLGRHPDLVPVACLHEQAAVIAAEYHARITGKLAAALVTCGPGGTNAVTGVASAWADSVPVLVLSGQVKRADLKGLSQVRQRGVQEIDIFPIVKPITKWVSRITEPVDVRWTLEKAASAATSLRPGPSWVDIPLDVQAAEAEPDAMPERTWVGVFKTPPPAELKKQVSEALTLLAASSRPVLLAGHGIRCAGAADAFRALVDRLGIPVLTTWPAMDLLEDAHPLLVGRPGSLAPRGANWALQGCDLLLAVGVRFDPVLTAFNPQGVAPQASWAGNVKGGARVVVDVDPAELAKHGAWATLPVMADAGAFLQEMLRQDDDSASAGTSFWLRRCLRWREDYPVVLPEHRRPEACVSSYHFAEVLSEELAEDDVVVVGSSGSAIELFLLAFRAKRGQRVLCSTGLGAMGFALPGAVGAALASGKRVVVVEGDGSFQLNVQELATIRRLGLSIKIFVLNNGGYASIRASQRRWFEGRTVGADEASGLWLPNINEVAEAYGLATRTIYNQIYLDQAIRVSLTLRGPSVTEVLMEPDEVRQPCVTVTANADGTMSSGKLEEMWPPLEGGAK